VSTWRVMALAIISGSDAARSAHNDTHNLAAVLRAFGQWGDFVAARDFGIHPFDLAIDHSQVRLGGCRSCTTTGAHPCPRLHRDWGSPLPHLHRDWGSPLPHLHRDCGIDHSQVWMGSAHAGGPAPRRMACAGRAAAPSRAWHWPGRTWHWPGMRWPRAAAPSRPCRVRCGLHACSLVCVPFREGVARVYVCGAVTRACRACCVSLRARVCAHAPLHARQHERAAPPHASPRPD
jgi:hypothetical protein